MNGEFAFGTIIAWLLMGGILFGLWGCPQWNVYSQRLGGEAELARADSNRRIAVNEAEAKLDASKKLADAEIERARGVAEANRIIGDSLKGNEAYLRYLYINNLEQSKGQIIYIPTEAGLPILEATRNAN